MNKLFLYLVIIGVLILVVVSAWEIYQVSSGAKSTGELTVVEIRSPVLIPKPLEEHFIEDPDFNEFFVDTTETFETQTDTTIIQ